MEGLRLGFRHLSSSIVNEKKRDGVSIPVPVCDRAATTVMEEKSLAGERSRAGDVRKRKGGAR